jgi:hypothetical protein
MITPKALDHALGEFGSIGANPAAPDELRSELVVGSCWIVQRVNLNWATRRSERALRPHRAASCWFVGRRGREW